MTAGNSTPLTDGASTVLLASEEWADAHDLPKLAAVVDGEAAAVDFVHGKDGLLMAPAFAVPRLLARNGLTLVDFADLVGLTGTVKNAFGDGGFPGVDVGNNSNISGVFERIVAGHGD